MIEAVTTEITVPSEIKVKVSAFRQPEIKVSLLEVDGAIFDDLMLTQEADLRHTANSTPAAQSRRFTPHPTVWSLPPAFGKVNLLVALAHALVPGGICRSKSNSLFRYFQLAKLE